MKLRTITGAGKYMDRSHGKTFAIATAPRTDRSIRPEPRVLQGCVSGRVPHRVRPSGRAGGRAMQWLPVDPVTSVDQRVSACMRAQITSRAWICIRLNTYIRRQSGTVRVYVSHWRAWCGRESVGQVRSTIRTLLSYYLRSIIFLLTSHIKWHITCI